jgi:hypothetical protein
MRVWIALVLLVLLPLQWGAALAASVCEPVSISAEQHLAHHHHEHAAASVDVNADDGATASNHADCGACFHHVVQPGATFTHEVTPTSPDRVTTPYAWHVPDAMAERLYRPPLARAH